MRSRGRQAAAPPRCGPDRVLQPGSGRSLRSVPESRCRRSGDAARRAQRSARPSASPVRALPAESAAAPLRALRAASVSSAGRAEPRLAAEAGGAPSQGRPCGLHGGLLIREHRLLEAGGNRRARGSPGTEAQLRTQWLSVGHLRIRLGIHTRESRDLSAISRGTWWGSSHDWNALRDGSVLFRTDRRRCEVVELLFM